ncbi:hypothetical protein [Staphylococcus gallinarum]|uniref:hypothetical protein n=1 Tax=Staphylococcus gallinarum TaxID=1293 RepID=UPI001E32E173|nr:hypothetical protein [Staphylococcus gallinarum]
MTNENERPTKEELWKSMMKSDEERKTKKSKSPSNDQYESFRARTSIKIHRDFKPLFDELVAEERENKIDFVDELLLFYAQEKHPEILEAFKKQELKTQIKMRQKGKA